jgi:hypothetical protein
VRCRAVLRGRSAQLWSLHKFCVQQAAPKANNLQDRWQRVHSGAIRYSLGCQALHHISLLHAAPHRPTLANRPRRAERMHP